MTARTHNAISFASLVTLAAYNPPSSLNLITFIGGIIASDIGALVPDIDDAGNKLWEFLPQGHFWGRIFRRVFYKHRTITHSILGVVLAYNGFDWLLAKTLNPAFVDPKIILSCLMIGYISHLVADAFTKEGLPLFFPLPVNIGIPPFSSLRITTGGLIEKLVVFPSVFIYLFWFIRGNQEKLLGILKLIH